MTGPVDEEALLRILQEEEDDSSLYYDSELAQAQASAMDRYHARPYGDGSEQPGRSHIVTHDIEDTINWMMPHIMRTFTSSRDLIVCDDPGLDDGDPTLADAASYLFHCMWKDSDGEIAIHDFAFDGLLQKMGVMRAYWEPPEDKPPRMIEGIDAEQLQRYANDPEYEILEAEITGEAPNVPPMAPPVQQVRNGPPGDLLAPGQAPPGDMMTMGQPAPQQAPPMPDMTFSVIVQRKPKFGRPKMEAIPPEQFRVSRRAKSLKHADYHGWKFAEFLDTLKREYPDKLYQLDPTMSHGGTETADSDIDEASDVRLHARFAEEPSMGHRTQSQTQERAKVWVSIEYIRANVDGDDVVELRRVKRCGDVILENDIVECSEFVAWSPIRVSHRLVGRSIADPIMDIARIRTLLTRAAMDSLAQSLRPRTVVNSQMIANDPSLMDRLLDHDVGDVIPVAGDPNAFVMQLATPDTSSSAFQAIEYWDRRSEEASGVNRHAMGIQPQAITDTAKGIESLQTAANARIEQVARWLGLALEEVAQKLLRLIVENQDQPRIVKVNGRKLKVDPRRWSEEMTVSIHVGNAGESRDQRLQKLNMIAGKQEQILLQAGPNNPIVTLAEYRHTLAQMFEAMGYRNPAAFVREIPPDWQPPDPGPNPKVIEAQEKAKLQSQELNQKAQIAAAEMQAEQQRTGMKLQMEREAAAQKAALDRDIALQKIAAEKEIAHMRASAEAELAMMRMQAEMRLAAEKMNLEAAMRKQNTEPTVNGYRPGGQLDA